jgi:hypothetical protein
LGPFDESSYRAVCFTFSFVVSVLEAQMERGLNKNKGDEVSDVLAL